MKLSPEAQAARRAAEKKSRDRARQAELDRPIASESIFEPGVGKTTTGTVRLPSTSALAAEVREHLEPRKIAERIAERAGLPPRDDIFSGTVNASATVDPDPDPLDP